jgi:hypothetical protein
MELRQYGQGFPLLNRNASSRTTGAKTKEQSPASPHSIPLPPRIEAVTPAISAQNGHKANKISSSGNPIDRMATVNHNRASGASGCAEASPDPDPAQGLDSLADPCSD